MQQCSAMWCWLLLYLSLPQGPPLLYSALRVSLGALEDVRGPGQPVNTAVTVQAPWEAAVSGAAHLDSQEANTLHHPAEETVRGLGGDGVDPLRLDPGDAGQHKKYYEAPIACHDQDIKLETLSAERRR